MSKTDYSKCSLDELKDILEWIDHDKWPDRVAEIESILNDPQKRRVLEHKQETKNIQIQEENRKISKLLVGIYFLIIAGIIIFTGQLIGRRGGVEIETIEARVVIGIILAVIAVFTIKSVFGPKSLNKALKIRRKKRGS